MGMDRGAESGWRREGTAGQGRARRSEPRPDGRGAGESHRRALLETDEVVVVETTYPAGAGEPMHAHPYPYVLYVIDGGTLESTEPDGTVHVLELNPREAIWSRPHEHRVRNIGRTPVRIVEVEVKHGGAEAGPNGTPY